MDGYAKAPLQTQNMGPVSVDLPQPPKWMKKPVGASFGVSYIVQILYYISW